MIDSEKFLEHLIRKNIIQFVGVPDSLLKNFCKLIESKFPGKEHLITANEGNAIGYAAGYYLATKQIPLVYFQNSGLGNTINPLNSLIDKTVYNIPMILMIGWRGEPEVKDAVQHIKQGNTTVSTLNALGINYTILEKDDSAAIRQLDNAIEEVKKSSQPYALLVKKDSFSKVIESNNGDAYTLTREEAIGIVSQAFSDEKFRFISTTGKISRELNEFEDKNQINGKSFFNIGAMGHVSSIALAVAEHSDKTIVCLDGDGSMIMHLGSVCVIGSRSPDNLIHVVLNNESHESVGGQPTAASTTNLAKITESAGYARSVTVSTKDELLSILDLEKNSDGLRFIEIKVKKGSRKDLGRPSKVPDYYLKEFITKLSQNKLESFDDVKSLVKNKKVFLVTGKDSFAASGGKKKLNFLEGNENVVHFNDFSSNPKIEDIKIGIELYRSQNPDMVIAIGGGSVMDVAKSINILAHNNVNPESIIKKESKVINHGKPLIAIPTTIGSGSESTHFSVVYIDSLKYSLASPCMLPNYYLLDGSLTLNLPKNIAASSGMDTFNQALESYWSVQSSALSRCYAKEALQLAVNYLEQTVNNPTVENRSKLLHAANLAGKAINISKTTAPHALSYYITNKFGIPHGHATALTIGRFYEYNSSVVNINDLRGENYVKNIFKELNLILGVNSGTEGKHKINQLMLSIGLEHNMQKLGIMEIDEICQSVNLERLGNNPLKIDPLKLKKIISG
jgi:phosphonopyruvate decarboxylase